MSLEFAPEPVPLKFDSDGNVRVSGTRVTLETLVGIYQDDGPKAVPELILAVPVP